MKILILGSGGGGKEREMLRQIAEQYGQAVEFIDEKDFYLSPAEQAPALPHFDEISEFVVEPMTIDSEFKIPDPTERELRLPYRDKKVMHPWRRRKKR